MRGFFYSEKSLASETREKRRLSNQDNLDVKKEIIKLAIELGQIL